jgi:PAS domain S-box-containing protein
MSSDEPEPSPPPAAESVGWTERRGGGHDRRSSEDALRRSERRLAAVFHLSPQPTAITRATGGFIDVNESFTKMSGYARDEIVGKTALELGLWTADVRDVFYERLRTTGSFEQEIKLQTKHGRCLDIILRSVAAGTGDDEGFYVNTATDVTDQRAVEAALRESEARAWARADELTAVMEAVPAAVLISQDPQCREVRSNRTGRELLRSRAGDNLSKAAIDPSATRHFKVFAGGVELQPDELPLERAARGVEVRDHEEEIRFADGQVIHLYGSAIPLRDPNGAPRGSIGAFVDVTRLKRAEAGMREADRRKDEFLALLSHELRNPLAPILNAAELMKVHGEGATPHEREVILRQAQHLTRLVDDLLDVSRVASGKVTLSKRPLEIASVVAKALEATEPLLEQRHQRFNLDVPAAGLVVDADEVRLTQVVSNLLSNAARYTPLGGRVEVTAAREGSEVVLRVCDDGIGIEAELLPHVFETFVQGGRGADRAQGGLGLGLSLVRTLTMLHGGTVEARSDGPDQGSELTVRLPASTARAGAARGDDPHLPRPAGARARRILVVDDNRDGAVMVASILDRAGHEVRVAHDPMHALALAPSFSPQVAILDIGLPGMDGYALGRQLRARLPDAPPVLIALSGYGQEQDKRLSKMAGFAHHLAKPVDAETLARVVNSFIDA